MSIPIRKLKIDIDEIVGKQFGHLTVISYAGNIKNSKNKIIHYYNCKCDCGNPNLIKVSRSHLLENHTQSCGHCTEYDIIGKRFGRLVVKSVDHKNHFGLVYYDCQCDCGNNTIVARSSLIEGNTKSCGCYATERSKEINKTHGMAKTSFWRRWTHLRQRCNNPTDAAYHNYGGRGITYDPRWNQFENFRDDMYESYIEACNIYGEENISIDRIDNNGNYCKENCRWVNNKIQCNNRRSNFLVNINGNIMTLSEIPNNFSIDVSYKTLNSRLANGWDLKNSILIPRERYIFNRRTHCPVRFLPDENYAILKGD